MAADLNAMYQNGMGSLASAYGGAQTAASQAQAAQDLRGKTLENDQAQVMNPLNAQFRQGQVAQQAAELPGTVGQSQSLAAKGTVDSSTVSDQIAAKVSALSTQVGEDGMKKMGMQGDQLRQLALVIGKYPPGQQKQALLAALPHYGGDPSSPMIQGLLQAPDEGFADNVAQVGTGLAKASSDYISRNAIETQKTQSAEKISAGDNSSRETVANIQATSRVAAADRRAQAMMAHMTSDQKIAALTSIPPEDRTPTDNAQLEFLARQRVIERSAGAPSVPGQVLNIDTPTGGALKAVDNNLHPTSAPVPAGTDVGATAKAMFGSYDPASYDYRVNPQTGKLQRKPK